MKLQRLEFFALGSNNEIQFFAVEQDFTYIQALIHDEVQRIEQKYSRFVSTSIISQINLAAGQKSIAIDAETFSLLNYADICYQQSQGLFDITSGVLRKIWRFDQKIVPDKKSIDNILPLISWSKVQWDHSQIFLPVKGMEIDFGGIGKEYAVDRIAGLLLEYGVKDALINLAGDIRAIGEQTWKVGIKHPRENNKIIATIDLKNTALATSGDYERFFDLEEKRYCHIINPKTGYPVQDLQSVSVLAPACLIAGSCATICMLLGSSKSVDYVNSLGLKALIVDQNSNFLLD